MENTLHEKIMLVKTTSVDWVNFRSKIDELFRDMNGLSHEEIKKDARFIDFR